MRLPRPLVAPLQLLAERIVRRPPDFTIRPSGEDYLRRWYVWPRNRICNLYLNQVLRSDDDRALHDHPWPNLSLVVSGSYFEHFIRAGGIHVRRERRAGDLVVRRARTAHRLEIDPGGIAWTFFLTGPRLRAWGFHCPQGWVHWRKFTDPSGAGIGKGCGE